MTGFASRESLESGEVFRKDKPTAVQRTVPANNKNVKYDLIGKLVTETGLTRKDVVRIPTGIKKPVFGQYRHNPEEFILKTAQIINEQKAAALIEHITYHTLDEKEHECRNKHSGTGVHNETQKL